MKNISNYYYLFAAIFFGFWPTIVNVLDIDVTNISGSQNVRSAIFYGSLIIGSIFFTIFISKILRFRQPLNFLFAIVPGLFFGLVAFYAVFRSSIANL